MGRLYISFILILFTSNVYGQTNIPKQTSTANRPFVLGVIDELKSTVLSEKRILNIYLPEGYKQDDTTKYPVIYLEYSANASL